MSSITINENPAARGLLAWRARADWWVLPAAIGVIALAAVAYLWNLTVSGFANTYYSMAAQAAGQSWSAWFWGSLDAGNFITVDKPPLATMAMGLSVRLFGVSSGAILLPEAIFGVATVALLYAIVRRQFGPAAATLAALVAALTPAAVLMFRYNNPDALLTLLLVGAAGALLRALENGRLRWVVLSAATRRSRLQHQVHAGISRAAGLRVGLLDRRARRLAAATGPSRGRRPGRGAGQRLVGGRQSSSRRRLRGRSSAAAPTTRRSSCCSATTGWSGSWAGSASTGRRPSYRASMVAAASSAACPGCCACSTLNSAAKSRGCCRPRWSGS